MCGTLKHGRGSTSLNRVGDPLVPVTWMKDDVKKHAEVAWGGFARKEATFWNITDPVKVFVEATSFVEGRVELRIPPHVRMKGYGLRRNAYVKGKLVGKRGTLKVLTRPASGKFELEITSKKHNKWRIPWCIDINTKKDYIFTPDDIVKGQGNLRL